MKNRERAQHGKGAPGRDRHGWVSFAEPAVRQLVNDQLAVPHLEIEARLWEDGFHDSSGKTHPLFPHILQEATNNLVAAGQITIAHHQTKGNRTADLYVPVETGRGRQTAITKAVRRKAMLYGRFLAYSATFGAAGEAVARGSLLDAIQHGYQSMNENEPFGEVHRVGKTRVRGSLDSGAWLTVIDRATHLPFPAHALLVEVKNRRQTLYPRHDEVHQLLHKAAEVQQAHPDLPIVPLLVCRRAHDRLFWMAKDLGFMVHQAKRQFLTMPPKTGTEKLEEVRLELGLRDLTLVTADSQPRIISLFRDLLPKEAAATAARWALVGSELVDHYEELRKDTLRPWERNAALSALRTEAAEVLDAAGVDEPILAWALEEERDTDVDY
jgi:hypothetical protein